MNAVRQEGRQEGREEGREEGRAMSLADMRRKFEAAGVIIPQWFIQMESDAKTRVGNTS